MDNQIDFEEASKEWRKNKVYLGNGNFAYKCQYIHTNRKYCYKKVCSNDDKYSNHPDKYTYCKKHLYIIKNKKV